MWIISEKKGKNSLKGSLIDIQYDRTDMNILRKTKNIKEIKGEVLKLAENCSECKPHVDNLEPFKIGWWILGNSQ